MGRVASLWHRYHEADGNLVSVMQMIEIDCDRFSKLVAPSFIGTRVSMGCHSRRKRRRLQSEHARRQQMNLQFKAWATGVALFFSLIFFSGTGLYGQGFQATLDGQVTDSAGAAVTGAKITVKEIQTGTTTIGVSGDQGYYHVGSLGAGHYSVTVEKPSFNISIREGVQLEVAQHATVDFK